MTCVAVEFGIQHDNLPPVPIATWDQMSKPATKTESGAGETATEICARPSISDAVLVVSGEGIICNFLREPDTNPDTPASALTGSPIESLWPGNLATFVRNNVKRTIRNRQVHSEEFEDSSDGGHYEIIFVAQGRDRALVVVRDISKQKTEISEIQHLAYVDEVTGLPNREYLLKELSRITAELRITQGRAAVIRFDIDQLDLAESTSGTNKQDEILKELSSRLKNGLRGVNRPDIKDQERYSIVARIDYRQFAVVLPIIEEGADAAAVAARLAESIQQPVKIGAREITVLVSTGIALFPQDGVDATALFENAGVATTDAKNSQTTRQKFHSGTVKVRALERQDLELELRSALDRDEFDLHYLPIVQTDTQKATTAEALLRWPQSVFGARSTQKLVSLAEYTGLIVPIGEWVLRRSCTQLHAWHAAGHPEMRLAVNLSVQEFSRDDLVQRIAAILDECSIDPRFLDFEITEHILFRDAMKEFERCRGIKELGARVVVDDYGTGACSLAHLSRSPIDSVKIDGSFVSHSGMNPEDRAACAAVIAMAHALDLKVVAESIETREQATLLRELGCDFLQGFLFCKPASAGEFAEYLASNGSGIKI